MTLFSTAKPFFVALLVVLLSAGCASVSQNHVRQIRQNPVFRAALLQQIEASRLAIAPDARLGVSIISLSDGQEIIDLKASEPFIPASTVKLLTGATALATLGPQYRFITELCVDEGGRAAGGRDIYLRGSGDPSLLPSDLAAMAQIAADMHVGAVRDVVIDDTDFDAVPYGVGWMWDDMSEGYSAPISAVNVASNRVNVVVAPGQKEGDPLRVTTTPTDTRLKIVIQGRTGASGSSSALRFVIGEPSAPTGPISGPEGPKPAPDQTPELTLLPGQTLVVAGRLASDASPKSRQLAMGQPSLWTGALLRQAIEKQEGLRVRGQVRRGQMPAVCTPLARHASAPLGTLLPVWMKSSDNHALECLGKRLAKVVTQEPGSFSTGAALVKQHIAGPLNAATTNLRLVDSSGTSHYNLVPPRVLTAAIQSVTRDFRRSYEFVSSLPIGGVDGTLARRFGTMPGALRAKTGTLTGVSSLAGILETQDGEQLAIAIMLDSTTTPAERLRLLQDTIVLALAKAAQMPLGMPPS